MAGESGHPAASRNLSRRSSDFFQSNANSLPGNSVRSVVGREACAAAGITAGKAIVAEHAAFLLRAFLQPRIGFDRHADRRRQARWKRQRYFNQRTLTRSGSNLDRSAQAPDSFVHSGQP